MTPKQEAALRLALEALKKCDSALAEELAAWDIDPPLHHVLEASNACGPAIAAIDEVLAEQPAQQREPVAWKFTDKEGTEFFEQREEWEGKWTPLYTSPPASKPHGFAGVTAWIGDATVTRIVTRVQIQHERVAGQSMTQAARVCLDMLAAHGIKGDA